jgi:probable F420-dependent oxidoreductase
MREYLQQMAAAPLKVPEPDRPSARILAALRPRMLRLAADHADGAHTYFVPVEHTRLARKTIGPDRLLVTELAVVLEGDAAVARSLAREHTSHYLARDNYRLNLRSLGFADDELAAGGNDAVVDALVAWGDAARISDRILAHRDAGADHVVLQLLGGGAQPLEQIAGYRRLAAAVGLG